MTVETIARAVCALLEVEEPGTAVLVAPDGTVMTEPPGVGRAALVIRRNVAAVFIAGPVCPTESEVIARIEEGMRMRRSGWAG